VHPSAERTKRPPENLPAARSRGCESALGCRPNHRSPPNPESGPRHLVARFQPPAGLFFVRSGRERTPHFNRAKWQKWPSGSGLPSISKRMRCMPWLKQERSRFCGLLRRGRAQRVDVPAQPRGRCRNTTNPRAGTLTWKAPLLTSISPSLEIPVPPYTRASLLNISRQLPVATSGERTT
jgi:hypothetical protein